MVHVLRQSAHDVSFLLTSALVSFLSMQCHADISMYRESTNQQIDGGYRSYASKFGPPVDRNGFEGFVTYNSSDGTGCNGSLIQPPPNDSNRRWILLLRRGDCNFVDKVRNAQRKDYGMVIVFNNASSIEPMHGENASDIFIPSVFVSQNTGLIIKKKYQYFNDVFVVIDDSNFPFDINPDLLLPFAVVVAVCFITMISFMICKCIRDRRRARRYRLPISRLSQIPIEKYSPKTCRFETCAICLEDYVEGERLRILPCTHAYHTKCIDPWLTRNRRVCPICKRRVLAANETLVHGSDSDTDSDDDEQTPLVRNTFPANEVNWFFNLFTALRHSSQGEQESTNTSTDNSSSISSISSPSESGFDYRAHLPTWMTWSINAPNNQSTSNPATSSSYPGTSTVQLPRHNSSPGNCRACCYCGAGQTFVDSDVLSINREEESLERRDAAKLVNTELFSSRNQSFRVNVSVLNDELYCRTVNPVSEKVGRSYYSSTSAEVASNDYGAQSSSNDDIAS